MPIGPEPRYRWKLLRAGPLRLDGGGMFGLIPRVVWSKAIVPDDRHRILVAHDCLLLERIDPAAGQPRRLLIETGSGDKMGPKMRAIFGLEAYCIIDALRDAGCDCDQIDAVIVSHLHFDHAGGVTRRARPGQTPDWTPPGGATEDAPAVRLTFPKAAIYAQRREWDDALVNRSVMTRTYLSEHLEPIRDCVRLVDSPPPFAPGEIPDRDQFPATTVAQRSAEILPGIQVFLTPGHTWGQQAVRFVDESGHSIVFVPDVMPTIHHVGAAYNLAYDVDPYMSMISRHWLLREAAAAKWILALDHEPGFPLQRVRENERGWFDLIPATDLAGAISAPREGTSP